MIGRTVGKYRIVGQIGRGGTGVVYKAVDESLNRDVAIKTLSPDLANTEVMTRFRAEATILARLNHPQIATIYELVAAETELLMVMEFVRGLPLDRVSERLGPLAPERAAYLIDQVLSGLEHAHRAGIVHRDVKPSNVMVTQDGGVKIMDFGIARVLGAEQKTVDFRLMGTPAYMSPEQVMGEEVDGRSDLYSVGVLLYRLLTGALPFAAETALGMLQRQIRDNPQPLDAHRRDLPDWCGQIMERALAKAPADRFQSAEEFRQALLRATGPLATTELSRTFAFQPDEGVAPRTTGALDAPPVASMPAYEPTVVEHGSAQRRRAGLGWSHAAATIVFALASGAVVMGLVSLPGNAGRAFAPPVETAEPPAAPVMFTAPLAPDAGPAPPRIEAEPVPVVLAPERVTASAKPLASAPLAPAPATPAPPVKATTPVVPVQRNPAIGEPSLVFDTHAFVGTRKPKEQKAQLVLGDGKITIIPQDDPTTPLCSFPYERVLSVEVSRSRDPLWNSPQGPAPVARAGGMMRRIGIHVARDWVALRTRTDEQFIALRFDEVILKRVLLALEERTGRTAALIVMPQDDRAAGRASD